jgi:hypothetical protein
MYQTSYILSLISSATLGAETAFTKELLTAGANAHITSRKDTETTNASWIVCEVKVL